LTEFLFRAKHAHNESTTMASRGRPFNLLRAAARQAGEKFYAAQHSCDECWTNKRYVINGNCVQCAINRGGARYASLDEEGKAVLKQKDHDRYVKRMAESIE
jgi:hypothetical protein